MATEPDTDLPIDDGLPPPPPPPGRPRPQPNFWWSLLACVGLTVVLNVGAGVGFIVLLLVQCAAAGGNFQTNLQDDLNGLQQAITAPPQGGETKGGEASASPVPYRVAISFLVGMAGTYALMLLLMWPLMRGVFGRGWTRVIALRRPGWAQLLIAWLVFLPGMAFTSEGIYALLLWLTGSTPNEGIRLVSGVAGVAPLWLCLLAIGVGPGILEEVFCRGFLARGLVGRHGWLFGVALTSLLFGLLHIEPLHAATTMLMGVCLHYSLVTSRSLWVPILLHATNNGLSVLQAKFLTGGDVSAPPWLIALRYGSAVVLVGLGAWALWSCRAKVVPIDDNDEGWRPRFPTVATPPPDSGLTTIEGRPNLLPLILAVVPLGGLVASMFIH